jgi:hypothetical protein
MNEHQGMSEVPDGTQPKDGNATHQEAGTESSASPVSALAQTEEDKGKTSPGDSGQSPAPGPEAVQGEGTDSTPSLDSPTGGKKDAAKPPPSRNPDKPPLLKAETLKELLSDRRKGLPADIRSFEVPRDVLQAALQRFRKLSSQIKTLERAQDRQPPPKHQTEPTGKEKKPQLASLWNITQIFQGVGVAAAVVLLVVLLVVILFFPGRNGQLEAKIDRLTASVNHPTPSPGGEGSLSPQALEGPLTRALANDKILTSLAWNLAPKVKPMVNTQEVAAEFKKATKNQQFLSELAGELTRKIPGSKVDKEAVGKALQEALKDKNVVAALAQAIGPGGKSEVKSEDVAAALTSTLKSPEFLKEFSKEIGQNVSPAPVNKDMVASALQEALKEKRWLEGLGKQLAGEINIPTPTLTAKQIEPAMTSALANAFKDEKIRNALTSPAVKEQLDVLVLHVHSKKLPVKPYLDAYRRLIQNFPRDPGNQFYRLGFAIAVTAQFTEKVSLKDGKITGYSFEFDEKSGARATEELDRIGPDVWAAFTRNRPNRRCLVVASVQCKAPNPDGPGWQKLDKVDVFLVRHDPRDKVTASLTEWSDFCSAKKGDLLLLSGGDNSEANDLLYKKLRGYADPHSQR